MKEKLFTLVALFAIISFTSFTDQSPISGGEEGFPEGYPEAGVVQIVKIKSQLPEEELIDIAKDRAKQFAEIPGLQQKYYISLGEEGEYGGIYIWDSKKSVAEFKESQLAATIGEAYQLLEPPEVEVLDVIFQLRE